MSSIKLKGDTSGEITIQAPSVAGTNTLNLQASSGTLATTAQASIGTKNLIINGNMQIAQRGTSVTGITTSGYFAIDRFGNLQTNLGTWTHSQDTDVPSGQGFANSLKMQCTTADATLDAADRLFLRQGIEAQNLQHLQFGTASAESITLSFWVKTNKTGTYSLAYINSDANRSYVTTYTISSANTWEKKTITIAGDTTGSIDNDNGVGLWIYWNFGAGSDWGGGTVNNAWETTALPNIGAGTTVNLADSTSNYINITGVQLEVGTEATPFEHRPYDMELARCYRYYYRQTATDNYENLWNTAGYSASSFYGVCRYPVTMRTAPSINLAPHYNQWCVSVRGANRTLTGFSPNEISASTAQMGTPCTGASQGDAGWVRLENKTPDGTYYFDLDAEL